jgi:hypothetical protein
MRTVVFETVPMVQPWTGGRYDDTRFGFPWMSVGDAVSCCRADRVTEPAGQCAMSSPLRWAAIFVAILTSRQRTKP